MKNSPSHSIEYRGLTRTVTSIALKRTEVRARVLSCHFMNRNSHLTCCFSLSCLRNIRILFSRCVSLLPAIHLPHLPHFSSRLLHPLLSSHSLSSLSPTRILIYVSLLQLFHLISQSSLPSKQKALHSRQKHVVSTQEQARDYPGRDPQRRENPASGAPVSRRQPKGKSPIPSHI